MAQSGEKYYKCPVCLKEFFKSHTMKIHLRVHTGEKPFQCNYCPKAFTTSGNLSDHLRVHSTVRMFKCKICGAKFKRNATLKRHYEMHAKYKREKQDNTDSVATGNSEGLLHTELVNQPVYFPRFDRSSELIVSEQGEETVQTEIVHHPSHVQFDDMPDQRSPTIELIFPPVLGREDQGSVVFRGIEIKEENLDAFHDATVLELTEEIEDIDGAQVKVYSFASTHSQLSRHSVQQDEETRETSLPHMDSIPENKASIFRPDESARSGEVCDIQSEVGYVQSDLAKRYGSHVTKMLKLIQPEDKQVELIKELNQAIHEFLIDNR
ncbi:zinc finger and BTB domain-containing protein 24-like [Macrobrachium nipponense]|uniref:zinc finger and BTB domain-containing protein 24-like n=1 Tax=Macrobrachium nipponense TaxID=159736 RepID=UPI0030C7A246